LEYIFRENGISTDCAFFSQMDYFPIARNTSSIGLTEEDEVAPTRVGGKARLLAVARAVTTAVGKEQLNQAPGKLGRGLSEIHSDAAAAKIQANEALQAERVQQVKFGSTVEEEAIGSRAQSLEAKQDLLTTELQLSDLAMQLNDAIGLPLNTPLTLERAKASTAREVRFASWRTVGSPS
jgi:hypothetical protein